MMKPRRSRTGLALAALVLMAAAGAVRAGPLTPPVGPVAPTGKTLTEVEPRIAVNAANTPGDADSLFRITQPGSYYLTGNITGVVGKHGIEIAASGVTLDLSGFDLAGVPAMGAFDGVSVRLNGLANVAVVNGSVRNWGGDGIDLSTLPARSTRVEGVAANGNAGYGIRAGSDSVVSACAASGNTLSGIAGQSGTTISFCTASFNTGSGIEASSHCTVADCASRSNVGDGIEVQSGSTVRNCTAADNTGIGITGGGSTITGCAAYNNGGDGIFSANGGTILDCAVNFNDGRGIATLVGCTVSGCTVQTSASTGIVTGSSGTVVNCTVYNNDGAGIIVSTGSTVAGCTVRLNVLNGVVCSASCVVRENTCVSNGDGGDGAGIHATGTDNRIEGNACVSNDRGIDVDGTGNIVFRNTCASNTSNWEIVAGNTIGPIIVSGTTGVAISGNGPASSTLGSTDPHANFTY